MDNESFLPIPGGFVMTPRILTDGALCGKPWMYRLVWNWLLDHAKFKNCKEYKRGQIEFTIKELIEYFTYKVGYKEIKPTYQEIRDALNWLKNPRYSSTHRTTQQSTQHTFGYTITTEKSGNKLIATIVNYDLYQNWDNYKNGKESDMD